MTLKDRLTENTHSEEGGKKYLKTKQKPQGLVGQTNIHFTTVQEVKESVVQEEKNIWENSKFPQNRKFSFTCITYRGTKLE